MDLLRQRRCRVLQSEGNADVEIVNAAVTSCLTHSFTLIGEDTDLLVLWLHHVRTSSEVILQTLNIYDINSMRGWFIL